jgi:hypothetical protein
MFHIGAGQSRRLRNRFRIEAALALLTLIAALTTLAWPAWIEALTGFERDGGSGTFELAIVAGLALASLAFALRARAAWTARRSPTGAGNTCKA